MTIWYILCSQVTAAVATTETKTEVKPATAPAAEAEPSPAPTTDIEAAAEASAAVEQAPKLEPAVTAVWECAVSLRWLLNFSKSVPCGYTTGDVTEKIIKPATQAQGCRYVDLIMHQQQQQQILIDKIKDEERAKQAQSGAPSRTADADSDASSDEGDYFFMRNEDLDLTLVNAVGRSDYFISHRWGAKFHEELLAPLAAHFGCKFFELGRTEVADSQNTFVWLDIFAVNQHPATSQADDLANLHNVIRNSKATLMVLDSPALVLTRIWCLYGESWHMIMKPHGHIT